MAPACSLVSDGYFAYSQRCGSDGHSIDPTLRMHQMCGTFDTGTTTTLEGASACCRSMRMPILHAMMADVNAVIMHCLHCDSHAGGVQVYISIYHRIIYHIS